MKKKLLFLLAIIIASISASIYAYAGSVKMTEEKIDIDTDTVKVSIPTTKEETFVVIKAIKNPYFQDLDCFLLEEEPIISSSPHIQMCGDFSNLKVGDKFKRSHKGLLIPFYNIAH